MTKAITTKRELLAAIRKAKEVLVQPRFGVNENWIKIGKTEAKNWLTAILADDATPEQLELYAGHFGELTDEGALYLG